MALENLVGADKFITALVSGNPVFNDDRREGDDHIRGVKNVLRNTFPNLNAAVTVTPAELNGLITLAAADAKYTHRANNLSDLASAFTSRTNLGIHDATGHWSVAMPTSAGIALIVNGRPAARAFHVSDGTVSVNVDTTADPGANFGTSAAGQHFGIKSGGSERMRFDGTSGGVTLNAPTASATALLVNARPGSTAAVFDSATNGVVTVRSQGAAETTVVQLIGGALTSANRFDVEQTSAGVGALRNRAAANMVFLTSNTTRMTLRDADGILQMQVNPPQTAAAGEVATAQYVNAKIPCGTAAAWTGTVKTFGTTYTNSGTRPLMVSVSLQFNDATAWLVDFLVDGAIFASANGTTPQRSQISMLVPPGSTYRVNRTGAGSAATVIQWSEC